MLELSVDLKSLLLEVPIDLVGRHFFHWVSNLVLIWAQIKVKVEGKPGQKLNWYKLLRVFDLNGDFLVFECCGQDSESDLTSLRATLILVINLA